MLAAHVSGTGIGDVADGTLDEIEVQHFPLAEPERRAAAAVSTHQAITVEVATTTLFPRERLEADAQVRIVHLVLLLVREQEAQMACDSEQQIVVERRQARKLVNE